MMKLILLSFFIASLAAVSPQLLPGCCPCGPDGPGGPGKPDIPGTDLIEFVVQTPDTTKGNPNPVIYDLITRLVNKGILPKNVATQLLITFRVPVPDNLPSGGNPLTPDTVNNLPIGGNPDTAKKVIEILRPVLNRPSQPADLLKILITLVLNNRVAPLPEIYQVTINNGVVPSVQIVVPEEKRQPNQGQPNQGQPNQGQPNQGQPNQPNQGQPDQPNQGQPNQGQPNQGQPNQGQPNQPNQGQPDQPNQGQPDQPNQGQPNQPNQGQPNQGQPDQPNQGQPNQGQPDQPNQGQPNQGQPDQPNQGQPNQGQPNQGQPDQPNQGQISIQIIPGQPSDSTVTITQVLSPDNVRNLVTYLLKFLLVPNRVIDRPTGESITITFFPDSPDAAGARPLNPQEPINVGGNPNPKKKFLINFIPLLANPRSPDTPKRLLKTILELVIDNGIVDLPTATQIVVKFGVGIQVQSRPDSPSGPDGPDGPDGPSQQEPVFPDNKLNPGQPSDSTVVISQVVRPENLPSFINRLLQILVTKGVIDQPTANRILITFRIPGKPGYPFNPDSARPLQPGENIPAGGNPNPKDRFVTAITKLVQNPQGPDGQGPALNLVRILIKFLIDNGIIDLPTSTQLAVTFGVGIRVESRPDSPSGPSGPSGGPVQEPQIVPGKRQPGQDIKSTVTITQVIGDVKPLIKRLVELTVQGGVIPQSSAPNLLATFNIPSDSGGSPISNPSQLNVGGSPPASQKFTVQLAPLLGNPSSPNSLTTLVKILSELLVDNAVVDQNTIVKFLVAYGVGSQIQIQFVPSQDPNNQAPVQEPQIVPGKRQPGQDIKSTVTITQVIGDVKPLIKRLVELTVQGGVIPQSSAPNLLATFNIPSDSGGSPISNPSQLNVGGSPPASQKFTVQLAPLLGNPSSPNSLTILVKILSELLVDNAVVDQNTIVKFLVAYGVGSQIQIQFVPSQDPNNQAPVQEPPLDKGNPPAGMQIDSTITITQVLKDVKPLIKRLVELNVQAGVIPQSSAPRLLITFNIPSGAGSPVSSPSQLNVGGNPSASQKFYTALTPLLGNPSSPNSLTILVKILSELLVDNNVVSHNSIVKFLVAYGVGTQIQVQYRPGGSGGQGGQNPVQEPPLTPGRPPAGMQIDSTVQITQVLGDLQPLIKRLVELNVKGGVIPQSSAPSLLASLGIQSGASPLQSTASLNLGGNAAASAKFIRNLNAALRPPYSQSTFVKILTELLVDNNIADMNSAMKFVVAYGVGAQIQVKYLPVGQGGLNVNLGGNVDLGGLGNLGLNTQGGFGGNGGLNLGTNGGLNLGGLGGLNFGGNAGFNPGGGFQFRQQPQIYG